LEKVDHLGKKLSKYQAELGLILNVRQCDEDYASLSPQQRQNLADEITRTRCYFEGKENP